MKKERNKIMSIQIKNERPTKTWEYDIDGISQEEAMQLRNYGLEKIKEDDDALINYAFNRIIFDYSQNLAKNVDILKKIVDKKKKSRKNA